VYIIKPILARVSAQALPFLKMCETRKFMLKVILRQLPLMFLSCKGIMSWFLEAWTTNMESISNQKLLQFFELANSFDLIAPLSSAKREFPKSKPSSKYPKNWPCLFLKMEPQSSLTRSKGSITVTFYPTSNWRTPNNLFYHKHLWEDGLKHWKLLRLWIP